jgi:hypothetical protein
MVRCFSEASGPFTTGAPGTSEASTGLGHQSAAAAIELCGHAWADGWLSFPELKDQNHPPQGNQPIPQLQACVLPDGYVGVFPGGPNTCTDLGLPKSLA